jgi:cytochrome P450
MQVPEDYSLFHHLMNSVNKETGQPLSNMQICAQAFTMLLAGTATFLLYALLHA